MAWATEAEVEEITGVVVTAAQLGQAQSMIELRVGRTEADPLKTRALHWLKLAVAYQAAWLPSQADVMGRSDVSKVIQDGAHVDFRPDGVTLAPLARRALRRLGWKGTRSVRVQPAYDADRYPYLYAAEGVGGVHDFADDLEPWRSL